MKNWLIFINVLMICVIFQKNCNAIETDVIVNPVDGSCLVCICQAISNCNKSLKCDNDVCGLFRITEGFWIDAGRPTLENEDPSSPDAYANCTNDEKCATITTFSYLTKYAQDCDGNGVIDCFDYALIHKYGGFGGCKENSLTDSGSYYTVLKSCLESLNIPCTEPEATISV